MLCFFTSADLGLLPPATARHHMVLTPRVLRVFLAGTPDRAMLTADGRVLRVLCETVPEDTATATGQYLV